MDLSNGDALGLTQSLKSRFYDRAGQPISLEEWREKFENLAYQRIDETTVGAWWVSTVWLGINQNPLAGREVARIRLFETMVFERAAHERGEVGQIAHTERYATEAEAVAGHARIVAAIRERRTRTVNEPTTTLTLGTLADLLGS